MSNALQDSINWVIGYLGYSTPNVGPNNEPAVTAANMVQQVMTSPPFHWVWNRKSLTFPTVVGTQSYVVQPITDFGFAEIATMTSSAGKALPLGILNHTALGGSSDNQQPVTIAVQEIVLGNSVTFRFLGRPNDIYSVTVYYQAAVTLMASLSDTWTPPDYMSYIYNRGFLAHCMEAKGDPRAQQEKVNFAAALLGASEGLTETEKNIFLTQYLSNSRDFLLNQLKTQQGVQARGT